MSNLPSKNPSYLSLDPTSSWHIGAFQAIAIESMTMSSRLRISSATRRGTLQDLEETFNSTGKRRIAKLELSIAAPDVPAAKLSPSSSNTAKAARNVGSLSNNGGDDEDDDSGLEAFDIDVFSKDYRMGSTPRGRARKEHVFGRAEMSRGEWSLSDDEQGNARTATATIHDRFHAGPVVQRYVTSTLDRPGAVLCHAMPYHIVPYR